jgi:hypothetical protein
MPNDFPLADFESVVFQGKETFISPLGNINIDASDITKMWKIN